MKYQQLVELTTLSVKIIIIIIMKFMFFQSTDLHVYIYESTN